VTQNNDETDNLNPIEIPEIPIIYRDKDLVVVDKPGGFHVHQPEDRRRRVAKEKTMLYLVRELTGEYLYPVHRLDVATSGVLIFALNKDMARELGRVLTSGDAEKQYVAIARGYLKDEEIIEIPLPNDTTGEMWEARTRYKTLARSEIQHAVGKRHASARYSLANVWLDTGRFHQIRRHLARLSHPLIGDRVHGDSHHNRFFRETLELPGLWLRAEKFSFHDPRSNELLEFKAPPSERWQRALEVLKF
jgi:tRNA pseudouridine65 synthase